MPTVCIVSIAWLCFVAHDVPEGNVFNKKTYEDLKREGLI